jgi:hypothetical protein
VVLAARTAVLDGLTGFTRLRAYDADRDNRRGCSAPGAASCSWAAVSWSSACPWRALRATAGWLAEPRSAIAGIGSGLACLPAARRPAETVPVCIDPQRGARSGRANRGDGEGPDRRPRTRHPRRVRTPVAGHREPGHRAKRALIVPGTKALHHVLPDLVPPMDRAWTGAFFLWSAAAPQNAQAATFTPDVHRAGAGGPRREASRIHQTRLAYQQVQGSGQRDHRLLHAQRDRIYTDLSQPALDSRSAVRGARGSFDARVSRPHRSSGSGHLAGVVGAGAFPAAIHGAC